MDMKSYLQQATPDERDAFAKKAGTSVAYMYQIAGGHKRPGTKLCQKLVAAEPKLTLQELRPDVWTPEPAKNLGRRKEDKYRGKCSKSSTT